MLWQDSIKNPLTYIEISSGILDLIISSAGSTAVSLLVSATLKTAIAQGAKGLLYSLSFLSNMPIIADSALATKTLANAINWGIRIGSAGRIFAPVFFAATTVAQVYFHNASFLGISQFIGPYINQTFNASYEKLNMRESLVKFNDIMPVINSFKNINAEEINEDQKQQIEEIQKVLAEVQSNLKNMRLRNMGPVLMRIYQYQQINQRLNSSFLSMMNFYKYFVPQIDYTDIGGENSEEETLVYEKSRPFMKNAGDYIANSGQWRLPDYESIVSQAKEEQSYLDAFFCGKDPEESFTVNPPYLNIGDFNRKTLNVQDLTSIKGSDLVGLKLNPTRIIKTLPVCESDRRKLIAQYPGKYYCPVTKTTNGHVLFNSRGSVPLSAFETSTETLCIEWQHDYRRTMLEKNWREYRLKVTEALDKLHLYIFQIQGIFSGYVENEVLPLALVAFDFDQNSYHLGPLDYYFNKLVSMDYFDNKKLLNWEVNIFQNLLASHQGMALGTLFENSLKSIQSQQTFHTQNLKYLQSSPEKKAEIKGEILMGMMIDSFANSNGPQLMDYSQIFIQ